MGKHERQQSPTSLKRNTGNSGGAASLSLVGCRFISSDINW
jgi:hypothetical protein